MRYLDVRHDSESREPAYPEKAAELTESGFSTVAHAVADIPEDPAHYARAYAESDRQWFLDRWNVPATVMVSPDQTTVVDLSEFHGGPSIRFRSLLDDGSLVETVRVWDRLPVLNPKLLPWGHQEGTQAQQTRGNHPQGGRSIRAVSLEDPSTLPLWQAHGDHLAERQQQRGAKAVGVQEFNAYVAICEAVQEHEQRIAIRRHRVAVALMLLYLVLGCSLALEMAGRIHNLAGVAVAVAAALYAGRGLARDSQWLAIRMARRFLPRFHLSLPPAQQA